VSSATLSHWIKNCLLEAGIDSRVFKAHSTRGAATSIALRAGISIPEIVRLADYTIETTFKKFYYRPVWNASVGRSVLSSTAIEHCKDLEALNIHCYIETSIMMYN